MKRWALVLGISMFAWMACDSSELPTASDVEGVDGAGLALIPGPQKQSCTDPDDPLCLPGPDPNDPDPDAPGYYIGPDYNMDFCRQSNDLDGDGFDDNCEYRIAHRFKPLLATNPSDDVSREPYWVASYEEEIPGYGTQEGVKIMYLFSYHLDLGTGLPGPLSGDILATQSSWSSTRCSMK